jgi:type I restriction enzyme, S subunit
MSLASLKANPNWALLALFERNAWTRLPFGAFADSVNERVEPADAAEEIYVGLEHLDPASLHIRRWGKGSDVIGTKLRFRKADIIFGRRRAYQRKLAIAETDGICSAHAMVVRAKPQIVLPEFLPFLMMSDKFMNRAVEISVGSMSPTINWTTLKLEEFDLPPLDRQRRIAKILWAADEAIERHLQLEIATKSSIDYSRIEHFIEAGCEGLTPLREVGRWVSGNTPSRSHAEFWNGSFPWVSPKDMKQSLISDSEEHLSDAGRIEATVVAPDTLLLVIRGMILAHSLPVAITGRNVAFNQDMKALIPAKPFSVKYLFNWFKWATPKILGRISDSSHGTKRLAMDDLFKMKVPRPEQSEQATFVQRIEALESVEDSIRRNTEKLKSLRASLLTEVFGKP